MQGQSRTCQIIEYRIFVDQMERQPFIKNRSQIADQKHRQDRSLLLQKKTGQRRRQSQQDQFFQIPEDRMKAMKKDRFGKCFRIRLSLSRCQIDQIIDQIPNQIRDQQRADPFFPFCSIKVCICPSCIPEEQISAETKKPRNSDLPEARAQQFLQKRTGSAGKPQESGDCDLRIHGMYPDYKNCQYEAVENHCCLKQISFLLLHFSFLYNYSEAY